MQMKKKNEESEKIKHSFAWEMMTELARTNNFLKKASIIQAIAIVILILSIILR